MSKFLVSKEVQFDAGHRVPLHESKCSNPHGHRYRVVAHVAGDLKDAGSETGMVIDFGHIKQTLTTYVHDVFDHGFIVQNSDKMMMDAFQVDPVVGESFLGIKVIMVNFAPTAEELARAIYNVVQRNMPPGAELVQIEVWETPTSCASYPFDSLVTPS